LYYQSRIFQLLLKHRPLGLRGFTNWTFGCFFHPLGYAFFVVGVFADKLHKFFIFLEFAVANRAQVFLSFFFTGIVALVFHPVKLFDLILRQALTLVPPTTTSCHSLQNGEKVEQT